MKSDDTLGGSEFAQTPPTHEYAQRFDAAIKNQAFNSLKSDSEDDATNSPSFPPPSHLGPSLPGFSDPALSSVNYGAADSSEGHLEGLPGKPQDLKAVIVKARFVTLSWKSPEVSNGELVAYTVYYRVEGSPRERTQNTSRARLEEANIGGLLPARVYYFRVVAVNSLGSGPTSDSLKVITQPEEHVPSGPLNVLAHAISPNSVHVSWEKPKITNGQIQTYKIFYMEVTQSAFL